MSVLVQISDPHFGTEQPPVVDALIELVQSVQPGLAVLSGDITQRARQSEFAAASRFVERLGVPRVLIIPGNHDIPLFSPLARLFYPYANYARAFGERLEPEHESEGLLVLCVNTTRHLRHTDGEVSSTQVERVAARLRTATTAQLRVVVTHQPVHVVRAEDAKDLLHGHAHARRTWSEAGADIIMGGHIHVPYVSRLPERGTNGRSAWVVQAGTAVSRRVRDGIPNSVNLVHHCIDEPGVCVVERWDYAARGGKFQRVDRSHIELERD